MTELPHVGGFLPVKNIQSYQTHASQQHHHHVRKVLVEFNCLSFKVVGDRSKVRICNEYIFISSTGENLTLKAKAKTVIYELCQEIIRSPQYHHQSVTLQINPLGCLHRGVDMGFDCTKWMKIETHIETFALHRGFHGEDG